MDPSLPIAGTGPRPDAHAAPRPALARSADLDRPTLRTPMDVPEVDLAFADIIDLFNPLQHIPVVSSIYRAVTGDEISGPAKVLGGALFGGPMGFVAGIIDAVSGQAAGGGVGDIVVAALFGAEDQDHATALAAVAPVDAEQTAHVAAAATAVPTANPPPATVPTATSDRAAPAAGQPLTGDAALQALAADLRGPGVSGIAAVSPASSSIVPRIGTAGVDARFLTPPPRTAFTARMLDGLDKYKALAAERAREQAASTHLLDQAL